MSILAKIKVSEVLEKIGITEEQFRGLLVGETEQLAKQEKVLCDQISAHAEKINDLYLQRQRAAQLHEQDRVEIENERKKIEAFRSQVQQEKTNSEREKQEIRLLRQKLNEDKEQYRVEVLAFNASREKLEADIKKQSQVLAELDTKSKALELQKDELYITQARVNEDSKKLLIEKEKFEADKAILAGEIATAKNHRADAQNEKEKYEALKITLENEYAESSQKLEDRIKSFEAEKVAVLEGFRKRELEIVRKEKEIEAFHASMQRKKEDAEIKEAKTEESDKKKAKKVK